MKDSISLVVTVYNGSRYLARAVDSVLKQKLSPMEIILVDDGSTDDSMAICRRYERQYDHIRIVSQSNGGEVAARKAGQAVSRGEWVAFMDVDDTMPPEALLDLSRGISDDIDIIVGEAFEQRKEQLIATSEFRSMLLRVSSSRSVWAKLYRSTLFDSQVFEIPREIVYGEDLLMNLRLSFRTEKAVKLIGRRVYDYHQEPGSVTHTFKITPEYAFKLFENLQKSIPESSREQLSEDLIVWRIGTWRELTDKLWRVGAIRRSEFVRQLMADIKAEGYRMTPSNYVQLCWTHQMLRLPALLHNWYDRHRYIRAFLRCEGKS